MTEFEQQVWKEVYASVMRKEKFARDPDKFVSNEHAAKCAWQAVLNFREVVGK